MKHKILVLMAAATMLFSGCAKDGDTGPAGPAGQDGNANVKSLTFTITPGQWQTTSAQNKYVEITVPEITQDILDNGMIITYFKTNGTLVQLPFTVYSGTIPLSQIPSFELGKAAVDLLTNTSGTISTPSTNYEYKVVISSGSRFANPKELDDYVKANAL